RAVRRSDGPGRRDPGGRALRPRGHRHRRARGRHAGQAGRHGLRRPGDRGRGARAAILLRGRSRRGEVAIDPGGARYATALAARTVVRVWLAALTLTLAACSTVSEVDRGVVLAHDGNEAGAKDAFDQAIKDSPTSAAAYANRGVVRAHQGDLDGAIADYT